MNGLSIWLGLGLQTLVLGAGLIKVYTSSQVRAAVVAQRLARIEQELGIKMPRATDF